MQAYANNVGTSGPICGVPSFSKFNYLSILLIKPGPISRLNITMNIITHQVNTINIAEVTDETILINNPDDALQLMVDLYCQGFSKIIIHEKNITPSFFDLKTGIAGDVLQKFSNYRTQLVIVGEFAKYPGKSIQDFIYESNKGRLVNFLSTVEVALEKLLR